MSLKSRKKDYGLTLIELLIVIVILGILSATIVFAVGGMTSKSAVASCQTDGATVSNAIDAFAAQNPGVTLTTAALTGTADGGPYISAMPSNGSNYTFSIVSGALDISTNGSAATAYVGPNGTSPSCNALSGAVASPPVGTWTNSGAVTTVSSPWGSGLNVPSGAYTYMNFGATPTTISFAIRGSAAGDFYFGATSTGAGYMVRHETRSPYVGGFATTTSWSGWGTPVGAPTYTANIWYQYNISISGGTASLSVNSTPVTTFPVSSLGTYLGVIGDGAGGSVSVAHLVVNGVSMPTP